MWRIISAMTGPVSAQASAIRPNARRSARSDFRSSGSASASVASCAE